MVARFPRALVGHLVISKTCYFSYMIKVVVFFASSLTSMYCLDVCPIFPPHSKHIHMHTGLPNPSGKLHYEKFSQINIPFMFLNEICKIPLIILNCNLLRS